MLYAAAAAAGAALGRAGPDQTRPQKAGAKNAANGVAASR